MRALRCSVCGRRRPLNRRWRACHRCVARAFVIATQEVDVVNAGSRFDDLVAELRDFHLAPADRYLEGSWS